MIVIEPRVEVDQFDPIAVMSALEFRGRRSYKSEARITTGSAARFIRMIIERGHESVLEHEKLSVNFVICRGVSHELVRHRIGTAYTQESTRYVDYGKQGELTVIRPWILESGTLEHKTWHRACRYAEKVYMAKRVRGVLPEWARGVLPFDTKTEVETTFNFREWRHVFRLRAARTAHPQMRQVMIPLLKHLQQKLPGLFEDISYDAKFPFPSYAEIVLREPS